MSKRKATIAGVAKMAILINYLFPLHSFAHHLLEEPKIACDNSFPCPDELLSRIHFWIGVYAKFGDEQVLFHDARHPSRLYSILETDASCQRGKDPDVIAKEKDRLKNLILTIAWKLKEGNSSFDSEEQHILNVFSEKTPELLPELLVEASDNIRCQEGNRNRFLEGMKKYQLYRDLIVAVLKSRGLSEDLQYLPFVESAYDLTAYSRLGAAGLWQIMPKTARVLGLKLNASIDERFDPEASTKAAARYLQNAYQELEKTAIQLTSNLTPGTLGPFVITSYNYGTAGVRRAMKQQGTDFVNVLYQYEGKRFKTAVQNFYASFLAARHVATNATKYFGKIEAPSVKVHEIIPLKRSTFVEKLVDQLKIPMAEMRELNPSLSQKVWKGGRPIPKDFLLKLPPKKEGWDEQLASLWNDSQGKDSQDSKDLTEEPKVAVQTSGVQKTEAVEFKPPSFPISLLGERLIPEVASYSTDMEPLGIDQDLFVLESTKGNQKHYFIHVENEETLGHYTEWLGIPRTQMLRNLNQMKFNDYLQLREKVRLPIASEKQKKEFEAKRIDYHQAFEEEFKNKYQVVGKDTYIVKKGDTELEVSENLEIPVWLLKRLNPHFLKETLRSGQVLQIPIIQERSQQLSQNGSLPNKNP